MKPTIEDTLILTCVAQRSQFDKAGQPDILHLLHVMANLESNITEAERLVSLRRDVVEDTSRYHQSTLNGPQSTLILLRCDNKNQSKSKSTQSHLYIRAALSADYVLELSLKRGIASVDVL
jgi:hypothetical protein